MKWANFICSRCGGVILVRAAPDQNDKVEAYWPAGRTVDASVPPQAGDKLLQAQASIGPAPSGAVMLAAAAVDAMLKDRGLMKGTLYARIDQAATDGLLTQAMREWAHDVRLDANDERHADENAKPPNSTDAERAVDFVEALAEYLYVLPSRVRRGREAAQK